MRGLKRITAGQVSGTGTVECPSGVFGGILLTTDGANQAVVQIREGGAGGLIIFEVDSVNAGPFHGPYIMQQPGTLYYSVTGTGASAMLYQFV